MSADTKAAELWQRADHYQSAHVRKDFALDPRCLVLATEGRGTEWWARTICFFKYPSANIYLATSWHVWGAGRSQDRHTTVIFKMLQTSGFNMFLTLLMSNTRFVCHKCCITAFNDAPGARQKKQIDNLLNYQEHRWNKIVFSNKKVVSFSFWLTLKGQYRALEIQ